MVLTSIQMKGVLLFVEVMNVGKNSTNNNLLMYVAIQLGNLIIRRLLPTPIERL